VTRAYTLDAGRLIDRLASGPATVREVACSAGLPLPVAWGLVRDLEARRLVRFAPLQRGEDLPKIERAGEV
jgi:DNA-binding IclR family transcriptional regulator